ncbi:MAG: hypothetical protein CVT49_13040 [candidate division Zixibacteria bacterium HGW-Zixibacteria-1]|nr:MAG: hypothetical protein CVT49_13040 [candidate division Zixibacteria bacterium HGW-Zixibacteria-1]
MIDAVNCSGNYQEANYFISDTMPYPKLYAILIAAIIIMHRLPGVISPAFFKRMVAWYTSKRLICVAGGAVLCIMALWGAYVIIADYPPHGWLLLGLSIVIFHKAVRFVISPSRAAKRELEAWSQLHRNIFFICLASVLAGVALIIFAIYII